MKEALYLICSIFCFNQYRKEEKIYITSFFSRTRSQEQQPFSSCTPLCTHRGRNECTYGHFPNHATRLEIGQTNLKGSCAYIKWRTPLAHHSCHGCIWKGSNNAFRSLQSDATKMWQKLLFQSKQLTVDIFCPCLLTFTWQGLNCFNLAWMFGQGHAYSYTVHVMDT